jgi:hypothetical protein
VPGPRSHEGTKAHEGNSQFSQELKSSGAFDGAGVRCTPADVAGLERIHEPGGAFPEFVDPFDPVARVASRRPSNLEDPVFVLSSWFRVFVVALVIGTLINW